MITFNQKTICFLVIGIILIQVCLTQSGCTTNSQCRLQTCVNKKCVAKNGVCDDNADCTSPNFCISGKCRPKSTQGGICSKTTDCDGELICENGKCLIAEGDSCDSQFCAGGKYCLSEGTCGDLLGLFEECGEDSDCKTGLVCGTYNDLSQLPMDSFAEDYDVCVVPEGGKCTGESDCDWDGPTRDSDYFNEVDAHLKCRSNGICQLSAGIGDPCTSSRDCGILADDNQELYANLICSNNICSIPQDFECDHETQYNYCTSGNKCIKYTDSCGPRRDIGEGCYGDDDDADADGDCRNGLLCELNPYYNDKRRDPVGIDTDAEYICLANVGSSCVEQDDYDQCVNQAYCFNRVCYYPPWIYRAIPDDDAFVFDDPYGVTGTFWKDLFFMFFPGDVVYYNVTNRDWEYAKDKNQYYTFSTAVTYKNSIYLIGGAFDDPVDSVKYFNPQTKFFNQDDDLPPLPIPLVGVGAGVHNGYLYVFGGETIGYTYSDAIFKIKLEKYDAQWEELDVTLDTGRAYFSAFKSESGLFFLGGGYDGDDALDSIEIFDANLDQFIPSNMFIPHARVAYGGGFMRGKLYYVYGYSECYGGTLSTVDVYDFNDQQWYYGVPGNYDRESFAFGIYNNFLYLAGGGSYSPSKRSVHDRSFRKSKRGLDPFPDPSSDPVYIPERYDGSLAEVEFDDCSFTPFFPPPSGPGGPPSGPPDTRSVANRNIPSPPFDPCCSGSTPI